MLRHVAKILSSTSQHVWHTVLSSIVVSWQAWALVKELCLHNLKCSADQVIVLASPGCPVLEPCWHARYLARIH